MKSPTQVLKAVLVISGLLLTQAVYAGEKSAFHDSGVYPASLQSPGWTNSLHGYGNLNITRSAESVGEADPQVGPIRLSHEGVTPPPSFTGSLSRIEKSPSF